MRMYTGLSQTCVDHGEEIYAYSTSCKSPSCYIWAHVESPKFTRVKKCKCMNENLVRQDGKSPAEGECMVHNALESN